MRRPSLSLKTSIYLIVHVGVQAAKARAAGLDTAAQAVLTQEVTPTEALVDYQAISSITDDSGNEIEVDFSDIEKQLAGVQAIIVDEWTQALDLLDHFYVVVLPKQLASYRALPVKKSVKSVKSSKITLSIVKALRACQIIAY